MGFGDHADDRDRLLPVVDEYVDEHVMEHPGFFVHRRGDVLDDRLGLIVKPARFKRIFGSETWNRDGRSTR